MLPFLPVQPPGHVFLPPRFFEVPCEQLASVSRVRVCVTVCVCWGGAAVHEMCICGHVLLPLCFSEVPAGALTLVRFSFVDGGRGAGV